MAKDLNTKFKDIKDDALKTKRDEAEKQYATAIANESPTPDEVRAAVELGDSVDEMDTELSARAEVAAEAATAFEAAKSRKFGADKAEVTDEGDDEAEVTDETETEGDDDEGDEAEVVEPTAEEVAAAAKVAAKGTKVDTAKIKTVKTLAGKTRRPAVPAENDTKATVSIVAAADAGYAAGAVLEFGDLAKGAINRLKGMPAPDGDGNTTADSLRKFPVAALTVPFSDDLIIDERTSDAETLEIVDRASDEFNIRGRDGEEFESLVAANGWCAPSETLYDLASDESLDGILSLPEVQVRRGGIRYTVGPQFADFYANAGFIQTEAQAIAGTTKPCYEVSCPSFTDVRLDAVGVCIKVPILLNAAYPEMTNRFTSGTLIAHQHMVNLNVIQRMVALSTAARVFAGNGGSVNDSLEAAGLVADQRRQSQRLAFNRTIEFVVPFWVKNGWLTDMARRSGSNSTEANEAALNAYWAIRNVNVSYVYDWQPIDPDVEVYPTTYDALMYPAGTFVKGVSDVINLSAVYDAASLAGNMYTGLFMEQGLLVAKKQYGSDLLRLPVCNAGRMGALNLTCA